MSGVPFARRVARPLLALVVAVTGLAAVPATASAAGEHHAAVIVETGAEVHRVVVAFSSESISGVEALQLAGADPQVAGFTGLGAGVSALYGVGHPAIASDCLGTSTDPRFWAYWHVPAGRSGFDDSTFSRAGAGTVRVHDGDVEGWRWGSREPPAFVLPDLPVPDPPAVAVSPGDTPSPSGSDPAPGGSGTGGPASPSPVPGGSAAPSTAPPAVAGGPPPAGGRPRRRRPPRHGRTPRWTGSGRAARREGRRRRRRDARLSRRVRGRARGAGARDLPRPPRPSREPTVRPVA